MLLNFVDMINLNISYLYMLNIFDCTDGVDGADGVAGNADGADGGHATCKIDDTSLPIFGWVIFIVLLIILTFVLFILGCWLIKTGVARNSTSRIIFGIIFAGLIGIIYYFILNNRKNNQIKTKQNTISKDIEKIVKIK